MVESDDEFTELCTKLLKRVKRSKPLEGQSTSTASTAGKSKLKKPKPPKPKSKSSNGDSKKAEQNNKAADGVDKPSNEAASTVHALLSNGHTERDCDGRAPVEETAGPQVQPCVKDLVLERMQQYKRASPVRMKLNSTETNEEQVQVFAMDVDVRTDEDLARALQLDIKKHSAGLEEEGLFFCQLCQKDLTAMSGVLREQHVNRCLDQSETLQGNPVAQLVPSCPLCGKSFTTEKARASHLKRCAAKLEVPAQTLLQAVQRQAAETHTDVPTGVSHAKRKGAPKQKAPSKKRKVAETEDLMVAMALSRSLQEENQSSGWDQPARQTAPTEKKGRRKKKEKPPSVLLVQAPEEAVQKLQKRLSVLLSEEPVENKLITLPASRFWNMQEEERETWRMQAGKKCVFWDISNMMETRDTVSYYTAELNPPIIPWKPPPKKVTSSQLRVVTPITPNVPAGMPASQEQNDKVASLTTPVKDQKPLSESQKYKQALLDLAELAGEGMTLTQWNHMPSNGSNQTGRESPASIACSGFIPSEEVTRKESQNHNANKNAIMTLAADFMEMVNNPHLSDAQLQTDCGEVLNVHMFVLYARCPLLVEAVHSEGFYVDEASSGRVKRFLLNDVSAESALVFLQFLYCAKTDIPSHCLPHVCELARRFEVKSLIDICELLVDIPYESEDVAPAVEEEEEDDGGEREENFQELLKSMWIDEDEELCAEQEVAELEEEEKVHDERVKEVDLEEIYEFAATQRRMPEEKITEAESSSEPEVEYQDQESEDQSPPTRSKAAGDEKPKKVVNQHFVVCHTVRNSTLTLSPVQKGGESSPLKKSPACPHSKSFEFSPARPLLASPSRTKIQPTPVHSVSPIQSPKSQAAGKGAVNQQLVDCHAKRNLKNSFLTLSPVQKDLASSPLKKSPAYLHSFEFSPASSPLASPTCTKIQPAPVHPVSPILSPRSQAAEKEQSKGVANQQFVDCHAKRNLNNFLTLSPVQKDLASSPLKKSPAYLHSNSFEFSPARPPLASPTPTKIKPTPVHSVSPVRSPSSQHSIATNSPTRSHVFRSSKPPESSSSVLHESSTAIVDTISLISPEGEEVPEDDLFTQHSPIPLDDSYDRIFSETCGEYVEPSGLCKSRSPMCVDPPDHEPPILTSSPSAIQRSTLPELGSSPKIQPQSRSILGQSSSSALENGNSQASICKDSKHSEPTQNSSKVSSTNMSAEQDIILILSSDEEADDRTQTAEVRAQSNRSGVFTNIKESPASISIGRNSEGHSCLDKSSSSEMSWLVPATPMAHLTATGVSLLQTLHQSPKTSKAGIHDDSLHDLVSPTQKNTSVFVPVNTTKTSSFVNPPTLPKTPDKIAESCTSTGSKISCVRSSPLSSIASSTVFEVVDSDEEVPVAELRADTSACSFQMDYDEPPMPVDDDLWLNAQESPARSNTERNASMHVTPEKVQGPSCSMSAPQERHSESDNHEESPHTTASQSRQSSYLNSKLWDEWEDEEPELPAFLPLSQRLNNVPDLQKLLRTPVSIVRKRELPPKVPITPLPDYSDMDTPVLKKELNRFGVRALPKKQMVLKLKEIFSYTHQVMSSDSEEDVPTSQPSRLNAVQGHRMPAPSKPKAPATATASSSLAQTKKTTTVCAAQEIDSADDQPPTASQESTTSSVAASDTSSISHSSNTNEFETAFADEDEEDSVPASQAANKEALTAEALRKFIEDRPDLHKRILLYQPLDLAALHAELKQSGIKVAAGKLLDFLDVHCVTFTTAAARKEKKTRGRRKVGKNPKK